MYQLQSSMYVLKSVHEINRNILYTTLNINLVAAQRHFRICSHSPCCLLDTSIAGSQCSHGSAFEASGSFFQAASL